MIKLSVIMPSLNVGSYIEEAIQSVTNQTLKDIEIICIDAGSTDGTWELIEKATAEDKRVAAVKSPVKSYGYQVNMGLKLAKGEYVAILETDDYVSEDMYNKLYSLAKNNDLDYAKCDYCTYTTDKNGERHFIKRNISDESVFYDCAFKPAEYPVVALEDWFLWNGIYKLDFIRNNGICLSETPGAAFQDIGFLHKVTTSAQKAMYLKGSFYRYCVDREGASSNSGRTVFFIRNEYGFLTEKLNSNIKKNEAVLLYRRMAKSFARTCMDCSDEVFEQDEVKQICDWFRLRLTDAENKGFLCSADLPISLREIYTNLLDSTEAVLTYRREKLKKITDFLDENSLIVVFGCGIYGKNACRFLIKKGYNIRYFMDNNETLWDTEIEGIKVISPNNALNLSKDTCYVIANEKYAEDIVKQLFDITGNEELKYMIYS